MSSTFLAQRLRTRGAWTAARIALLPSAVWLIALLVNEPFGRMVLVLAVTVGIVLAGGLVGWIWGPKTDPAAGWRPLSLIAGVAFSGVAAVALVISAAMVLQDLVHERFSVETLEAAPFVLVAGWYALLVTPFIPAFLVALPMAWLWYRLMVRAMRADQGSAGGSSTPSGGLFRNALGLAAILVAVASCSLPSTEPMPSGFEHDGYVLACGEVETESCIERADEVADWWRTSPDRGDRIRWIEVRPDESRLCEARGRLTYCSLVYIYTHPNFPR